jgi:hypothetical protein
MAYEYVNPDLKKEQHKIQRNYRKTGLYSIIKTNKVSVPL